MEVYVVVNRAMTGREAMGVFSTPENAENYVDRFAGKIGYLCQIEKSFVRGSYQILNRVFAAHAYRRYEDVHVLEGIYAELSEAQTAVGREGKVIEFSIDANLGIVTFRNE